LIEHREITALCRSQLPYECLVPKTIERFQIFVKNFKDFRIKAERKAKSSSKIVAKGDEYPRFAAQRESPGLDNKNNPKLKASNKSARLLLAFSEPLNYFLLTRRYSPDYNIRRLWRLNLSFQTVS
jgi:hypothetical protein